MIKTAQSEIIRSLPPALAAKPETAAVSYAIARQIIYLSECMERIRIYSDIDSVPENILDILAAEMKSPQYDAALPVSSKRSIVKNALLNWITNGTVSQLMRSVGEVFGDGSDISEWFDYGGNAGYFKITTDNPEVTDDTVEHFKAVVNDTKRLSAKLEGVTLALSVAPFQQIYGFAVQTGSVVQLTQKEE